jgi:histidinol-phosphate aminotransferase
MFPLAGKKHRATKKFLFATASETFQFSTFNSISPLTLIEMDFPLLSDKARSLAPYVAGEQPRGGAFIKLNTNENPYPPSPAVAAVARGFDTAVFRKYPDPEAAALRDLIARKNGLSPDNILCGNGSDEILAFCFQAFFSANKPEAVFFPDITYSFYKVWCGLFGIRYFCPPVNEDFEINLNDYLTSQNAERIRNAQCAMHNAQRKDGVINVGRNDGKKNKSETVDCALCAADSEKDPDRTSQFSILNSQFPKRAGIVIANPNAPTGIALPTADIEKTVAANPHVVVIVDEAYAAFSGRTCLPLVKKYKNLCVVQTFSKSYGLAGLRVGFAAADTALIAGARKIRDSFNSYPLDCFAAACAAAAYGDEGYLKETAGKVIRARENLSAGLKKLGFKVLPSGANFVFARHKEKSGAYLCSALRERGILARRFDAPRIADWLRITVGTDGEMNSVLAALGQVIEK